VTKILNNKSEIPSNSQDIKLLDVIDDPVGSLAFQNFCNGIEEGTDMIDHLHSFDDKLAHFGAVNLYNSNYIEFESEAKKAWFVLRWS
jgi:hypothetical protein